MALAVLPDLQAGVAVLPEEDRRLRDQQNRNSGNSSRPPSSDLPWPQRPRKPPTGKKPGDRRGILVSTGGWSRPVRSTTWSS